MYEAEIVSGKFYVRRKHLTFPICWWSFVVCDECREHTNRSAPLFRILHSAKYQLLWPAASTQSAAEADELKYLQHTDQVIMSVLEQLQSLSREELIIFLSVIVGSIILVTIIITILCVYCCRRANRSRGEKVLPSFCFLYIFFIGLEVSLSALSALSANQLILLLKAGKFERYKTTFHQGILKDPLFWN